VSIDVITIEAELAIEDYVWGRGTKLVMLRAYTGLSQEDFADALSRASGLPLALRSYQRMEKGMSPIHTSVWESAAAVHRKFDAAVAECVAEVEAELRTSGEDPATTNRSVIVSYNTHNPWQRCVLAHAMHRQPALLPVSRDDQRARTEVYG
jgi:hypothetical protein